MEGCIMCPRAMLLILCMCPSTAEDLSGFWEQVESKLRSMQIQFFGTPVESIVIEFSAAVASRMACRPTASSPCRSRSDCSAGGSGASSAALSAALHPHRCACIA